MFVCVMSGMENATTVNSSFQVVDAGNGGYMKFFRHVVFILILFMAPSTVLEVSARDKHTRMEGAYQVVEGSVSRITARMLIVDGQQYPVSMFARVFMGSLKGQESSLQTLSNIGRIDLARLYLLRGRVEKIIVIHNL